MTRSLTMTVEQEQLYERIQAFRFDEENTVFPFAARLGRDNGWSAGYTARVISEYRRFAFLAVAAGHPVTPPDQVDQAWHLHLLYTLNYWDRFCKEVLKRPLHHGPTKGGDAEREKFSDWYGKTLESYRRFFGEDPPADIWPAPKIRFGEDIHYQRVNTRRHWIIPKASLKSLGLGIMACLMLLLVLMGCGGSQRESTSGTLIILAVSVALGWVLLSGLEASEQQEHRESRQVKRRKALEARQKPSATGVVACSAGCGGWGDGCGGDGGCGGCGCGGCGGCG